MNFIELFISGGALMWVLLSLFLISMFLIIERFVFYSWHYFRVEDSLKRIQEILTLGGADASRQLPLDKSCHNPLLLAGAQMYEAVFKGRVHFENIAQRQAHRWINRYERGLRLLALIGVISPLIGLLGTVWGMVLAFEKMAALSDKVTPADFAEGISLGLMTTVAGLVVAIPAIAATKIYERKVDKLTDGFNEVSSHLEEWFFNENED
mgnify:CR=1 FL=1